jgi:predicted ribosome quality control (RQC) complex YloA/Tae2 family protein
MFSSWLTLYRLARELDVRLRNCTVTDVYTQERNELMLMLEGAGGSAALHCSAHPQYPWCTIEKNAARARRNSIDLFKPMIGAGVESVSIARGDRVLRLNLDGGRVFQMQLFAARANMFLIDLGDGRIDCFKQRVPLTGIADDGWIDTGKSMMDLYMPEPADQAFESVEALATEYRFVRGVFGSELRRRVHENESGTSPGLLAGIFRGMLSECESGDVLVYEGDLVLPVLSLVRLDLPDMRMQQFPSVMDAMDRYLRIRRRVEKRAASRTRLLGDIGRELASIERALADAPAPADRKREADKYEMWGHLLMAHPDTAPVQPGQLVVPDLFNDRRLVVCIPLREDLSNVENAELYYDKARRIRDGIVHAENRRETRMKRYMELEGMKQRIEQARDAESLDEVLKELEKSGRTPARGKGDRAAALPYRSFTVGGYTVLVGKSSADNEEVTFKYAGPDDMWLHARGVSGSHVVIKLAGKPRPGKDVIRKAAALAAYYSKYRTAGNVPVAYTEKKYVHKLKGAPVGTVRLDREEVVMVKPAVDVQEDE